MRENYRESSEKTIEEALFEATEVLRNANVANPRAKAEVLLCEVLKTEKGFIYTNSKKTIESHYANELIGLARKRAEGEPIQYVLGSTWFRYLKLKTDGRALIPRPETELIVDLLVDMAGGKGARIKVADIGTGCGCIALSIAREMPLAEVFATDISREALELARENADTCSLSERVVFLKGNLMEAFDRNCSETFDSVVSNPPYISEAEMLSLPETVKGFEPKTALFGGRDGMGIQKGIIDGACEIMKKGACLIMEIGEGQAKNILDYAVKSKHYRDFRLEKDFSGVIRFIAMIKK